MTRRPPALKRFPAPDRSAWIATSNRSPEYMHVFQTTIEFRPTLQQRDDACTKGQLGRAKIFDGLLARLDENAS